MKCANVLVDNDATIKLSDFGASKILTEEMLREGVEGSKSLKGSPYWIAPEVVLRSGHAKPADIWSIGCCVIEMLKGRPPWSERTRDGRSVLELIKRENGKIKHLSPFQSCLPIPRTYRQSASTSLTAACAGILENVRPQLSF